MESLLVAGAETMTGANFAVQLAETYDVTAGFFEKPRTLPACRTIVCRPNDEEAAASVLQNVRPTRLVYCGAGSNSAWTGSVRPSVEDARQVEIWLKAARAANVAVTLISSDAVFTGPWMFHAEKSQSFCPSPEAQILLRIERIAQETLPESLIIRTNAFGWGSVWLENLIASLAHNPTCSLDCVRHASPILVNDLIDIVVRGWHAGLAGVYHVAGGERTNPAAFAQRLAAEFALKAPRPQSTDSLTDKSSGFGQSETSLQTRKIRQALNTSVPLLGDSLRKLRQLSLSGFRDKLHVPTETLPPKKAA
jgi:dTDP-4-dehydrorhamnose reductase